MCGTCSNFKDYKNGIKTWSNFTDAELRDRCRQELNTTADSLINDCVNAKKAQMTQTTSANGTPQWVGYVEGAGNILSNAAQIFGNLFGQQAAPQTTPLPPPPSEPKGLGMGTIILIILGVVALGGTVWYFSSKSKK